MLDADLDDATIPARRNATVREMREIETKRDAKSTQANKAAAPPASKKPSPIVLKN
jgi:hypothetical protein